MSRRARGGGSERARDVLRCIDVAATAQEHHPALYAKYSRQAASCWRLARAIDRYRLTRAIPVGSRPDHDQVERVDAAWEETYARESEDEFGIQRRSMDAERRGGRGEMPLPDRLRRALDGLHAISTVPASNPAPGRGGESLHLPNFRQKTALDECDGDLQVIRARVQRIEDRLDAARGLAVMHSTITMTAAEKNKVIVEKWEGVPASIASAAEPWLGSPETFRRVRKANDRDTLGRKVADKSNEAVPEWARAS